MGGCEERSQGKELHENTADWLSTIQAEGQQRAGKRQDIRPGTITLVGASAPREGSSTKHSLPTTTPEP